MYNFLYVFFMSVYPHQLVLGSKFNVSKCIDIDISKKYNGENPN